MYYHFTEKALSIRVVSNASRTFPYLGTSLLLSWGFSEYVLRYLFVADNYGGHLCLWPWPQWPHWSGCCHLEGEGLDYKLQKFLLEEQNTLKPIFGFQLVAQVAQASIFHWRTLSRNSARVSSMFLLHPAPLTILVQGRTPDSNKSTLILCPPVICHGDKKRVLVPESPRHADLELRGRRRN